MRHGGNDKGCAQSPGAGEGTGPSGAVWPPPALCLSEGPRGFPCPCSRCSHPSLASPGPPARPLLCPVSAIATSKEQHRNLLLGTGKSLGPGPVLAGLRTLPSSTEQSLHLPLPVPRILPKPAHSLALASDAPQRCSGISKAPSVTIAQHKRQQPMLMSLCLRVHGHGPWDKQ